MQSEFLENFMILIIFKLDRFLVFWFFLDLYAPDSLVFLSLYILIF